MRTPRTARAPRSLPPGRGFFDDLLVRHMMAVALVCSVPVVVSAVVWHREAVGSSTSTLTGAWLLYAAAIAADIGCLWAAPRPMRSARTDGARRLWLAVSFGLLLAACGLAVAASSLAHG